MNKIIRLSRANIRKHKTELLLTAVLVMVCMLMLGSSISGSRSVNDLFYKTMERTDSLENFLFATSQNVDDTLVNYILENDDRVERFETFQIIENFDAKVLDAEGKEQLYPVAFFTEDNERRFQNYEPETSFSAEEIAAIEHPIWLPIIDRKKFGLHEGDAFHLIFGMKRFSFTVAGFYESGVFLTGMSICVISDNDYAVIKNADVALPFIAAYTAKDHQYDEAVADDFCAAYTEMSSAAEDCFVAQFYKDNLTNFHLEISIILTVMKVMASVIILAVTVMIAHQIVNAIQDQIVSIGVLEALGYRSHEIALSYAFEYLLIAAVGCTAGFLGCFLLTPVLIAFGANLCGYVPEYSFSIVPFVLSYAGILLTVFVTAYIKAAAVRKYPPVLAFRKGIGNHHFGKTHFPLRDTKKNVHLRLSMKGFADQAVKNIGLTFVLIMISICMLISSIFFFYLGTGKNIIRSIAGHEISDLQVVPEQYVDMDAFAEELRAIPSVDHILQTIPDGEVRVKPVGADSQQELYVDVFRDYTETQTVFPIEGRFPEHDNEVMLTLDSSKMLGRKIGESITLSYNDMEKQYLVTGIVNAFYNAACVYMTEDGLRCLNPLLEMTAFNLYLKEGESLDDLKKLLNDKCSKSVAAIGKDDASGTTYEERIRRAAEQQMAEMMQQDGVFFASYSIQAGDTVISGDSSAFRVRFTESMNETLSTALAASCQSIIAATILLTSISAFVVMMMLFILMETEVDKQRRAFGVMKGLGYTSRELMLQLVFKIMPFVVLAVVIGTVLTILVMKSGIMSLLLMIQISVPVVIVTDLVIIGFCFACAYWGARRIKKISVCELMTE